MAESKVVKAPTFLRFASPNERRTISREDVGFYNTLTIAAIYEAADGNLDLNSSQTFISPLKQCIMKHPFLSVIVKNKDTENPFFEAVSRLDLNDHISIIGDDQVKERKEMESIENILPPILDRPWPADIPPWRIVVLPLASESTAKRCFIAFSFSHTIGDGMIGHIFHHTFVEAWESTAAESSLVTPPNAALTEAFDTPERLPISWGFLLRPLISLLLPKFIANIFHLRASSSTIDAGTWTSTPIFYEPSASENSRVRILELEGSLVQKTLQSSRNHDSKLTATLHQLIVRALSKAIPQRDITNFVSGTAVDMRKSIGAPADTWGLFVTGHYEVHPRVSDTSQPPLPEEMWQAASLVTKKLAECATQLQDQPIGLLRYAPSIRGYTLGKLGSRRDCSFDLSNLLAFDGISDANSKCKITKMVFVQPGNVLSAPLQFNIISVKGGSLVCAVSWQAGALDVPLDEEKAFVDDICSSIRADLEALRS
ncbi:hypothetical protein N7495_004365 [Penicillium taxi]|uniref:uncharacterized protein n=1 Tax=Penicillium taxi TaxID=168475 RepID=UPI0025457BD2|nr:uncharacterized protein N7495_004365 [Penicillium taxi]KAJ5899621.1 hypothetical protein N7495_004365 [Penicillium taxi]